MTTSPLRRALALFLATQPVFWMSGVAYAQSLAPTTPNPAGPSGVAAQPQPEPDFTRSERPVGGVAAGTPAAPAIDEAVDPDRYVCGPGDVFELNFWGVQNFRQRIQIDVEGRAFVARIGYFALQGKTLTQARRVMRDSVARFYPRLSFDITLAEPRTFLVQVVDDVVRPGSYPARAVERVATIISRAGGFAPAASRRRIEIRRRDGSALTADLLLYTLTGDVKFNPFLLDGDVIRVPFEDLAASIGGAVNRPGRYELVNTRDVAELVQLAGGLSQTATQLLPLTIVRRGRGDRQDLKLAPFELAKLPAATIEPEDAVHVPGVSELQQSVTIVGAIAGAAALEAPSAAPGTAATRSTAPEEATATRRLPFVQGDTVRTLLERVGGTGPLADLGGSYILRNGQTLPVDLYALVMLRDFKADRAVELGDTLVIPFKRRNIVVEGAVFAPGSYPYNPAFSVEQYLALAGGRSRNAESVESVKIVTSSGETKTFRPDLKVDPGSSLVVPERNFSRSEVVQIVLGAAGIILSGVAVVIAARK